MKIVVTGGHHTTAFAVIDELKRLVHLEIIWLGHKYSLWGDKAASAEYQSVRKRGIRFVDLKAGRFYRTYHPLKLLRIPIGFIQSFYFLVKFRPDLIFSFGGYLAVPVVVLGWLLRIPSVTHEQTTTVGLANKMIARFVKKIFISWPESEKYFPKEKVVITGNPLRKEIFNKSDTTYPRFKKFLDVGKKTIYVTGGKQGSHVINEVIKVSLGEILKDYNLFHQCGGSTLHNDYEELLMLKNKLPEHARKRYLLKGYFDEGELGSVYALSDLIISRGGANTVYEIAALGKVAVFIPIPWLPYDEQTKNAQVLEEAGSAKLLAQDDLTGEKLLSIINQIFNDYGKYLSEAEKAKSLVRLDAAEKIVTELRKTFPELTELSSVSGVAR